MNRTEQRLQRAVEARLEPDEHLVAWAPAWVSRYQRFHFLLALRNRDFAVVTNRRLMLWSTGFFTRRPKRRVLSDRLDELTIESTSRDPGRVMACSRPGRPALLLELGKDARSDRFSIELRDRSLAAKAVQRHATAEAESRVHSPVREEAPTPYEFGLFTAPPADDEPAPEPEPGAEADDEHAPQPEFEPAAEPAADAAEPATGEARTGEGPTDEPATDNAPTGDVRTDEPATDAAEPATDLRPWP